MKHIKPARKKMVENISHWLSVLRKSNNNSEQHRLFSNVYLKQTFAIRETVPQTARINRRKHATIPHSYRIKTFPEKN